MYCKNSLKQMRFFFDRLRPCRRPFFGTEFHAKFCDGLSLASRAKLVPVAVWHGDPFQNLATLARESPCLFSYRGKPGETGVCRFFGEITHESGPPRGGPRGDPDRGDSHSLRAPSVDGVGGLREALETLVSRGAFGVGRRRPTLKSI